MNVMNSMLYVTTGAETALAPQAQPQTAQESEPNKFESVMREKHQEAAGKPEQKEQSSRPEARPEGEAAAEDQKIPAEQYVLAAALVMQPRPEITYVQPEQIVTEQPVEAAAPVAVDAAVGTVPEMAAAPVQLVQPENVEAVPAAVENVPVAAAVESPVFQEAVERVPERRAAPEQKTVRKAETETARPVEEAVQTRKTSERPQMVRREAQPETVQEAEPEETTETKPEVSLEVKPQSRAVRQDDDSEETPEVQGAWSEPVFKQVEAVPVKVAAPEKPVDLEAPEAPVRLGERLSDAIEEGKDQIQIRLSPEGLGEVNVTITRMETGVVSIVLRAVEPKAAGILQQHTAGIQNVVAGSVRGEVQIEVRAPENSQQQLLNPDGDNSRRQQGQQRQRQDDSKQANEDFMQKLRLGLTDLIPTV